MNLANAAVTIIANGWTVQDFLVYFGRCFIRAAGTFGYEKLIKVSRYFFYTSVFYVWACNSFRSAHSRVQIKLVPVVLVA